MEFGGEKKASRGKELKLSCLDRKLGKNSVKVLDRGEEDLGRAVLLLTHLQHPVSDNLPVMRKQMLLYLVHVVSMEMIIVTLRYQEVL